MRSLFRTRGIVVIGIWLIVLAAGGTVYKLRGVLVPPADALIRGIPIASPQEPSDLSPAISSKNG